MHPWFGVSCPVVSLLFTLSASFLSSPEDLMRAEGMFHTMDRPRFLASGAGGLDFCVLFYVSISVWESVFTVFVLFLSLCCLILKAFEDLL